MSLWIIILAFIGLIISYHIYSKKNNKQKLICMSGSDCTTVINSEYSKTFGVENSILGILYYVFLIGVFLLDYWVGFMDLSHYSHIILVVSGLAGLTSLYLVYVQFFVIKKICEYCLITAVVNILIFIIIL